MMKKLFKNQKGAAVIELSFALPVLVEMMWMVVQGGLVFRAMSGIQHGLGEGARYATIYPQPDTASVKSKIQSAVYGIGPGNFTITTPTTGTSGGATYMDLTVTYSQATDFIFFTGPTISVTRSKRVWVAS